MSNENYQFHVAKYLYHSIKLRDHFVKMDSESVWEEQIVYVLC